MYLEERISLGDYSYRVALKRRRRIPNVSVAQQPCTMYPSTSLATALTISLSCVRLFSYARSVMHHLECTLRAPVCVARVTGARRARTLAVGSTFRLLIKCSHRALVFHWILVNTHTPTLCYERDARCTAYRIRASPCERNSRLIVLAFYIVDQKFAYV